MVRSSIPRRLAVLGALVALTMWPASVFAQSSSLFGSGSSSSGSRGTTSGSNRSSAGTSGSGGRSTSGQSGFGGSGAGGSGFGQTGGRGQSGGFGQGGGLGQGGTGTGQFGLSGQSTGQNGFVGRSDNSGRFVGNQTIGQQGSNSAGPNFSGLGGGRGSRTGTGNNRNNSFGNNGFGSGGLGAGERKLPVPLTKIAFKYSTPETEALTGRLSTRLAKSSRITEAGVLNQKIGVEVEDGGVARLTGSVDTSEQKSLIEAYVRLEPGVRKVVSEIAVSYADPPPTP
ncbi:MAG: BON domain-containing protein [Planctomycetaceae bacterium]|jgi:hypothetical protein|nr:BON domain-containing protein [Planctomycetaceae bacterium]